MGPAVPELNGENEAVSCLLLPLIAVIFVTNVGLEPHFLGREPRGGGCWESPVRLAWVGACPTPEKADPQRCVCTGEPPRLPFLLARFPMRSSSSGTLGGRGGTGIFPLEGQGWGHINDSAENCLSNHKDGDLWKLIILIFSPYGSLSISIPLYSPPFRACSTHALSMNVHAHTSENSVDLSRPRRLSPIKRQNLLISTSTSSFALKSAPGDSLERPQVALCCNTIQDWKALSVCLSSVNTIQTINFLFPPLLLVCAYEAENYCVRSRHSISRSPNACLGKTGRSQSLGLNSSSGLGPWMFPLHHELRTKLWMAQKPGRISWVSLLCLLRDLANIA